MNSATSGLRYNRLRKCNAPNFHVSQHLAYSTNQGLDEDVEIHSNFRLER